LTMIGCDLRTGDSKIDQVVEALSTSGLVLPGGIATSLLETGQQWFVPPLFQKHFRLVMARRINTCELLH